MSRKQAARKYVRPLSAAVTLAVAGLFDSLSHASDTAVIAKAERGVFNVEALNVILRLRSDSADTGAYLAACQDVFGNRERHTSKTYRPGALRQRLTDNGVDLGTIKVQLSQCYKVASYIADPAAWEHAKGANQTLAGLYKAAVAVSKPVVATVADVAPPAVQEASEAATLEQVIARFGIAPLLGACARILATRKATKTQAATLEAVAAQVAASK